MTDQVSTPVSTPEPTSPPAGTVSDSNPNPAVAVNPDNAKPQTPDPTLVGYSALKAAMTKAGHVLSEGEGFLIHEFGLVRSFLSSVGLQHIGDEWHRFEHAVAQGAHDLAPKLTAEAAHLAGLVKNGVETEVNALTGKVEAKVTSQSAVVVDTTEADAKKVADAAAADLAAETEAKAKAEVAAAEAEAKKLADEAAAEAEAAAAAVKAKLEADAAAAEAEAKKLIEPTTTAAPTPPVAKE